MLTGTVTWDVVRPDAEGTSASGTVTFVPSVRLVHTGDVRTLVNVPVVVDAADLLEGVALPANDDPGLEPAGWTWRAIEQIAGKKKRAYSFTLLAGQTVDLSTVAPVDPVEPQAVYVSASSAVTAAALREIVEDIVGGLLEDGPLVDFTYDDASDSLTATITGLTSGNLSDFAEAVRDRLAATLAAGPNVTVTVDDPGDTVTIGLTGVATDQELADAVTAEALARGAADSALSDAIDDEAVARAGGDAALDTRLDPIEAELAATPLGTLVTRLTALETPTVNEVTDSYTLVLGDAGEVVRVNKATAAIVTVPPNASVAFPVGTLIEVVQTGAGQVSIAAGAGVTVNSYSGWLNLAGQYAAVSLLKTATNTWLLTGNLIP